MFRRKKEYEIAAVGGVKLPQSPVAEMCNYNLGNSFKPTKYRPTLLERSFPFVFRQQSQQHTVGEKNAKYQGFIPKYKYQYMSDDSASAHHVPKGSEKFILKLPHKLNELKQKSDRNANANVANNNRDYSISNSNLVTSVHSYPSFNSSDLKKNNFNR